MGNSRWSDRRCSSPDTSRARSEAASVSR